MRFETVSGKARIAANSRTIGKIRNAAGGRFGLIDGVHELIRGSLGCRCDRVSLFVPLSGAQCRVHNPCPASHYFGMINRPM